MLILCSDYFHFLSYSFLFLLIFFLWKVPSTICENPKAQQEVGLHLHLPITCLAVIRLCDVQVHFMPPHLLWDHTCNGYSMPKIVFFWTFPLFHSFYTLSVPLLWCFPSIRGGRNVLLGMRTHLSIIFNILSSVDFCMPSICYKDRFIWLQQECHFSMSMNIYTMKAMWCYVYLAQQQEYISSLWPIIFSNKPGCIDENYRHALCKDKWSILEKFT